MLTTPTRNLRSRLTIRSVPSARSPNWSPTRIFRFRPRWSCRKASTVSATQYSLRPQDRRRRIYRSTLVLLRRSDATANRTVTWLRLRLCMSQFGNRAVGAALAISCIVAPTLSPGPATSAEVAYDWSGFYFGGHMGYGRGTAASTVYDPSVTASANSFGS